jgi:hypothetical protein
MSDYVLTENEMTVFRTHANCTKCNNGELICYRQETYWDATPNSKALKKCFHRCNSCGNEVVLEANFPYISYKEKKDN